VYVITLDPAETPNITPVFETLATPVFDDIQGLVALAFGEPVKDMVLPAHAVKVPVIVGNAFIVTLDVIIHPLELV
jgi:hypothetical protein